MLSIPNSIINIILDYLAQLNHTKERVLVLEENTGNLIWKSNLYCEWFLDNARKICQEPDWKRLVHVICQNTYDAEYIIDCDIRFLYSTYPNESYLNEEDGTYIRSYEKFYLTYEIDDKIYYCYIHYVFNHLESWLDDNINSYIWNNGKKIGIIKSSIILKNNSNCDTISYDKF